MMRQLAVITGLLFFGLSGSARAQITQCLIDQGIVTAGACAPIAAPEPYIEGTCLAGVQRYLARAVSMEDLAFLNFPGTCWGLPDPPNGNVEVNCQRPYTNCWTAYCPSRYCSNIAMLVDLQATFIARAATFQGRENEIAPGKFYRNAAEQLIRDVHAAYDCASLRRPIVQGGIFEAVLDGIEEVTIPSAVIWSFVDEFSPADLSYYTTPVVLGGQTYQFARTDLKYARRRINFPGTNNPDIRNIETRMWFYHQARFFIDAGYKALHMGQVGIWGREDRGYAKTYRLFSKIRDYATSRDSFVLLNAENPRGKYALKHGNTENLLFDFDGRTARPREIVESKIPGENGCDDDYALNMLNDTDCKDEDFKAFIDRCVVESFGEDASGISPMGCTYEQVPYFVYWDFGPGWYIDEGLQVDMAHEGNNNGTWGWDDTRWFATRISPECRADWFEKFYGEVRDFHNSQGFLQVPGIIGVPYPENADEPDGDDVSPIASGKFMLIDEQDVDLNGSPDFQDAVRALWTVSTPRIFTQIQSRCDLPYGRCERRGKFSRRYRSSYRFVIGNPDASSVYSWHIKRPNGSWEPFTYGRERVFKPVMEGVHTIYLRWDNMGLDPAAFGSQTISVPLDVEFCCVEGDGDTFK